MEAIALNLISVRSRISAAAARCGRNPDHIRLVAVSKTKPVSDIMAAYEQGQRHFGENYVQELVAKAKELPKDIQWHFIGTLQSNKINDVLSVENLFAIESVGEFKLTRDSVKKAKAINSKLKGTRKLNIFLQVNTSGEQAKTGVNPEECTQLVQTIISECRNLQLMGLMTIGAADRDLNQGKNPDFVCLDACSLSIKSTLGLDLELSMGMSDDFEHAIECNSTSVRVGSSIFGSRK